MPAVARPTPEQIAAILAEHKRWLACEIGAKRADLTRADLTGAVLTGAVLTRADLTGAVLTRAVLTRADLTRAFLTRADLTGAVLTRADLTRAILTRADLTGADLTRADLTRADLTGADLTRADLTGAVLTRADLTGAVLTGADMPGSERWEEYLSDVVPALLVAGGKTVGQIVAAGAWECHQWSNCPMHAAYEIGRDVDGPKLLVPRIREFVHLFDQGLIPKPRQLPDGTWTCLPELVPTNEI